MNAPTPPLRPFIVPVFIPHAGCPHRCIFCNQHATTGQKASMPSLIDIRKHIDDFLAHRRDPDRYTEISFYGGTFLGLAPEQIQLLLATAAAYVRKGLVDGIRFSTRPDTIDAERLDLIAPYPVTTIELGVQSMQDDVLVSSARGHTADETRRAVALLSDRSFGLGLQMMIGLPGDTTAGALATGRQLAGLTPDFVRIYPTVVFKGSPLARWYLEGCYEPLSLDAAVALCAELYLIFARHDIPVIRMGLQAGPELAADSDLVAGPFHPAFGELVRSAIWQDAISRHLEKEGLRGGEVVIEVHSRLLSQIKGQHDHNIIALLNRHDLRAMEVRAKDAVPEDTVLVNGVACRRW